MHARRHLPALIGQLVRMRASHPFSIWLLQSFIVAICGTGAFFLRFDLSIPPAYVAHLAAGLLVWIPVKAAVFYAGGLNRSGWRFVSLADVVRIGVASVFGSAVSWVLLGWIAPAGFPRSIYLLDLLICFLAITGVRVTARFLVDASTRMGRAGTNKRTLIYGAGRAGDLLLREIHSTPDLPYTVCGFVDDDPRKLGVVIHGVRVVGPGTSLPALIRKHSVEEILIALHSATGPEMTGILRQCHEAGVSCRTVPSLAEIIQGRGLVNQIRNVAVEDLLGRTAVCLDEQEIRDRLEGRVAMVTGAGGSIGSELCRQIARFRPRAIVGYEISENALFHLALEMKALFPDVPFHAEIGSIQSERRLSEVLERHAPSILYHAAAYKHVPMMEAHVFEAIENNVFGTYRVARAAARHGVADFLMISSDKAVNPTSVMGVTKRVAELLVHALQGDGTKMVSVRFGNVLGSNGSVVPLFKRQIAAGGPVTVTHPEMRRYFMTIPEAVVLVLQASTMGKGGEIFVLDMGEPVKIVDLAKNLILLSGLRPDQDIKIVFSGIRPGEKLSEELSSMEENTVATYHEKIKIFNSNGSPHTGIVRSLEMLHEICECRDFGELVLLLKELVPDYNPSAHLLRQVIMENPGPSRSLRALAAAAQDENATTDAVACQMVQ